MKAWLELGLCVLLLVILGWSSTLVVESTHEQRRLYADLHRVQSEKDALLTEQAQLMLERGAMSAYQNVERVAVRDLKMRFPHSIEFVQQ